MLYRPENEGIKKAERKIMELLEICQQYQIPMFVSIAVNDDGNETQYFNQMYSAKAHNILLSDDQIEKHVLVAGGFSVVPPRESLTLDMGELITDMGGIN